MNRDRFETLLAAYGADPKRWPEAERADAEAFMAAHPDVAAEAREIDALLEVARENAPANPALASKIMNAAPRKQVRAGAGFDRRAALALAACAVFGIVLGYGGGRLAPVGSDPDAMIDAAIEASFGEASWGVDGG